MRHLFLVSALAAVPAAHAAVTLPAEGVWGFPASNGSGLTLDVRDRTIGIGLYTYDEDGDNVWYSGAGQLVDGVLDTTLTQYRETAPGAVEPVGNARPFRLTFGTSTHATLRFDGTDNIAVEHLPFGAQYLADWSPDDLPDHALPDLRGRWVFGSQPIDPISPSVAYDIDFTASAIAEEGHVATFRSIEYPVADDETSMRTYEMRCAPVDGETRCDLTSGVLPVADGDVPVLIGSFDPRALSPNRAEGEDDFGKVYGFRQPSDTLAAPQPGIWQIVGRNGSGMTLDVREDGAAVGFFSYDDEGNATWSLAQGPIVANTLAATLTSFTGGSCLSCPQQDPDVEQVTRSFSLQFASATRALLTIGDDDPLTLVLLPYGAEYVTAPMENDALEGDFGAHPVPKLSGRWVFSQGDIDTQRTADAGIALDFLTHDVVLGEDGVHALTITARAADIPRGLMDPPATEHWHLECSTVGEAVDSTCDMGYRAVPDSQLDNPPAFSPYAVGDLSDLSGTRYVGTGTGGTDRPVWGFQLPAREEQ